MFSKNLDPRDHFLVQHAHVPACFFVASPDLVSETRGGGLDLATETIVTGPDLVAQALDRGLDLAAERLPKGVHLLPDGRKFCPHLDSELPKLHIERSHVRLE
jgi:hypothetical protein